MKNKLFIKNKLLIGGLAIIIAQVCWSTIEIAGIFLYKKGANAITLLSGRYLIATLLIFLMIFIHKKELLYIKKKDIKILIILGSILVVHLLAFWQGIKTLNHIPTAIGIYYTFPVWIMIFSVIFWKEKMKRLKVLSLAIGVIGSLFIAGVLPALELSTVNILGVGLMFIASICWAIYAMVGKSLFKKYHPFTILLYNFLFVFIVVTFMQNPLTTISQINMTTIPYLLYMAVVCTFIAFVLFYGGINYLRPSTAGIISYIKPVLGVFLSFIVLNHVTGLYQAIGIIMVLISGFLIYNVIGGENENKINKK